MGDAKILESFIISSAREGARVGVGSMAHDASKLVKKLFVSGHVTALSGLHIGGADAGFGIGGTDQIVVRDAFGRPYLPGSTLKGRMRSLLEQSLGKIRFSGGQALPWAGNDELGRLFGRGSDDNERGGTAARLLVRDGALENWKELLDSRHTELPFTEVKTEIAVDRISARATARHIERVPAGARFSMRLVLSIHEGDDEAAMLRLLCEALTLVQDDALGGHGSRGYGEISISIDRIEVRDRAAYTGGGSLQPYAFDVPPALRTKAAA
jgi:CRISPR-associated protein Csm3